MKFIDLAEEVSSYMPNHVVRLTADVLNSIEKSIKGSDILIVGVAYKPDIDDVRESPALDIIKMLQERGANVFYHDPYVQKIKIEEKNLFSTEIDRQFDCSVIATNHKCIDYHEIIEKSKSIVDTRNSLRNFNVSKPIERL